MLEVCGLVKIWSDASWIIQQTKQSKKGEESAAGQAKRVREPEGQGFMPFESPAQMGRYKQTSFPAPPHNDQAGTVERVRNTMKTDDLKYSFFKTVLDIFQYFFTF